MLMGKEVGRNFAFGEEARGVSSEVVVTTDCSGRYHPISWCPIRIDVHLRIVRVVTAELFSSVENFTIVIMMKTKEGISYAAGCKSRGGAKFLSQTEE